MTDASLSVAELRIWLETCFHGKVALDREILGEETYSSYLPTYQPCNYYKVTIYYQKEPNKNNPWRIWQFWVSNRLKSICHKVGIMIPFKEEGTNKVWHVKLLHQIPEISKWRKWDLKERSVWCHTLYTNPLAIILSGNSAFITGHAAICYTLAFGDTAWLSTHGWVACTTIVRLIIQKYILIPLSFLSTLPPPWLWAFPTTFLGAQVVLGPRHKSLF